MKRIFVLISLIVCSFVIYAQNIDGIYKFDEEQSDLSMFESNTTEIHPAILPLIVDSITGYSYGKILPEKIEIKNSHFTIYYSDNDIKEYKITSMDKENSTIFMTYDNIKESLQFRIRSGKIELVWKGLVFN